jgi:mRNA interferase MazF
VIEGVPERGDIVWLNFDPQAGREQTGRRPALVLSCVTYNRKVGLMLCCPITSKIKGYPFEVALPEGLPIAGVILSDQIRNLDWRTRNATEATMVSAEIVQRVCELIQALWEPDA